MNNEQDVSQLEAMERELESFSYAVAHDLHAPLRAILHFSKMLDRRISDKLEEREQEMLRQIPELAEKSQKMLDALLEYSRIGHPSLNLEVVDVAEEGYAVAVGLSDSYRDLMYRLTFEDHMPAAECDRRLLHRLLKELISNAVQFNDDAEYQVVIGFDSQHQAYFVKDNGIGMSPAGSERAQTVFCRLHRPGVYGDGLGMGLTVATKIARIHGGELWLKAQPDIGTCVYFHLGLQHGQNK